jgi:flagellar biogenesis protein FliO
MSRLASKSPFSLPTRPQQLGLVILLIVFVAYVLFRVR